MRAFDTALQIVLISILAASCAGSGSQAAASPTGERNVLTHEQIRAGGHQNMYAALLAMRPHWLRTRGRDSFRRPSQVQVYRDDSWLGGVETLRAVSVSEIGYVRYYDGLEAAGRWGLGHGQGVVYLATRMR